MKPARARKFRLPVLIGSALILLLFTAFALFFFGAQYYLDKNLSDFVSKKSKGKYELSFDNLTISFRHWGIEINDVSFHPTDSILKNINRYAPDRQFYSFSSPSINVSGIKLMELLFNRKLIINQIHITQPELAIHGQQAETEDKRTSFIAFFQELKPLVTKTFRSINVKKIEFSKASFDFYQLLGNTKKLSNAENITIGLVNFYTDSLLLPDPSRLFKTDDVYLSMQHYQKKLADSLHIISAQNITYSLKHARITIQNLKLQPYIAAETPESKYQVSVPDIVIKTEHIDQFYQNNAIPIDTLILTGASISYWPGKQTDDKKNTGAEFDLYQLIKNEITSIRIGDFDLRDASLTLFKAQGDLASEQTLQHIGIKLEDFKLDSTSVQDTSRIFYAKNIDFQASNYELTLGDNIHHIKAGNLILSTRKSMVLVKKISMEPVLPDKKMSNYGNYIHSACDSIRLDKFDFKKAYNQKRFHFQHISLFNPEVKIIQNEVSGNKASPEGQSFVYKLIAEYAKGIYSDMVLVNHGKFQYINQTGLIQKGNIQSQVRLLLTGFALDETSAQKSDRLFYANQIELNFKNYQMQLADQLHKLTIDAFDLSTRKKAALVSNLHLFPVSKDNIQELLEKYNRSELYEFTVPSLALTNTDFHKAFFNKKLATDTLNIQSPDIYYENFAFLKKEKPKADFEGLFQLLSDYLDDIHINRTVIADGTIRLINHSKKGKTISLDNHFDLGLENTLINKEQFGLQKLLFSEYVDFTVHNHLIRLSDQVHVLKVDELGFSTKRKEVFATGVTLYPETNNLGTPTANWNVQVMIPDIRIQGADMIDFYFNRKINAQRVLINSPEIRLYQKIKNTQGKNLRDFTFLLPKEIETMTIQQFELKDGSLQIFSEPGISKPYLLVQTDLKMQGQNIVVENNPALGRPEFKQGDYTSVLNQFKFTPKDKNQQFSFDELKFSTTDRTIQASQLSVKPKKQNSRQNQFNLTIPTLRMSGFDLDRAYRNDEYFFESIYFDRPSFQLNDNTKDSLRINPFKTNLYPYFESFARVFAAQSIHVNNADVNIFKNNEKKFQQTVTFDLDNVRIDDQPSAGFLHSMGFSFRIPGLVKQLKYTRVDIGETIYDSKKDVFRAKNIQIIPSYSKEKQQSLIGFQSDYFSGTIDSALVYHPDIRRWFGQEELIGQNIQFNGLKLNIYRDKRLPFNENQRPKMLQDMIKSLKYPMLFDSLTLKNSEVQYEERPESGETEGKIWFTRLDASLKPFSNIKQNLGGLPDVVLDAKADIMDSCRATVHMAYQMNDPENSFTVKGSLKPFNMHIINPVLEPLASVSVRSGRVNTFNFSYTANNALASGELYFGYDDLRISVLENRKGNIREQKFASFLANSLLLRTKNPRGKELTPDPISFERDRRKSILNYWWKAVFSGVRNTLGIKENKGDEKE